jgi:hypothetical protein
MIDVRTSALIRDIYGSTSILATWFGWSYYLFCSNRYQYCSKPPLFLGRALSQWQHTLFKYVCLFEVFRVRNVLLLCIDIVCISIEWCCVCWYVCFLFWKCSFVCALSVIYCFFNYWWWISIFQAWLWWPGVSVSLTQRLLTTGRILHCKARELRYHEVWKFFAFRMLRPSDYAGRKRLFLQGRSVSWYGRWWAHFNS